MTKNKYKHKQVMKLVVMTDEDVFPSHDLGGLINSK